jgi:hypothetical protein
MSKMLKTLTAVVVFGASANALAFDTLQCLYRHGSIESPDFNPNWPTPQKNAVYLYEKEVSPNGPSAVLFLRDSFAVEFVPAKDKSSTLSVVIRHGESLYPGYYLTALDRIYDQAAYSETRQDLANEDYTDKVSVNVRLRTQQKNSWFRVVCAICTKGKSCDSEDKQRKIAQSKGEDFKSFTRFSASENNPEPLIPRDK